MPSRLGIDIGGTTTDFLLLDESTGRTHSLKVPTHPDGAMATIGRAAERLMSVAGIQPGEIETVVHGAPEVAGYRPWSRGSRIGLLATKGFEQVLYLARGRMAERATAADAGESLSDLVRLDLVRGIVERVSAAGNTITQLDEAAARQSIGQLVQAGAEVIAICLINAHANPAHELRLRAIAREISGEIPVVLSHEVAAEAGEYERALATVIDAGAQPGMRRHLDAVESGLKSAEITPRIDVAQSTGGRTSARAAAEAPVTTLLSSPAGGVVAAARLASLAGFPDTLVLDMGGMATDVSLIRSGMPRISSETFVGRDTIRTPSIDVRRIGAGSGSIARAPAAGTIRVGPDGAGTDPGPAHNGRGGAVPTVTDANIVLGRLPAGRLSLDIDAAESVVAEFARKLGLDRHRAAEGIVEIFNESVAGALRLMAVEKGEDPDRLAILACGGAGPMHGCAVGMSVGSAPVIIPRHAGVLAALGFLHSDRSNQFVQGVGQTLDEVQVQGVADIVKELGARAEAWLNDEGVSGEITYRGDLRYFRGHLQISVRVDPAALSEKGALAALGDRMAEAHRLRYGFKLDQPVEIVALRAIATAATDAPSPARLERGSPDPRAGLLDQQQVYFDGTFRATPIYDRDRLTAGNRIAGPALIFEPDTTTVIHPGHAGEIDEYLNILIRPDGGGSQVRH